MKPSIKIIQFFTPPRHKNAVAVTMLDTLGEVPASVSREYRNNFCLRTARIFHADIRTGQYTNAVTFIFTSLQDKYAFEQFCEALKDKVITD